MKMLALAQEQAQEQALREQVRQVQPEPVQVQPEHFVEGHWYG